MGRQIRDNPHASKMARQALELPTLTSGSLGFSPYSGHLQGTNSSLTAASSPSGVDPERRCRLQSEANVLISLDLKIPKFTANSLIYSRKHQTPVHPFAPSNFECRELDQTFLDRNDLVLAFPFQRYDELRARQPNAHRAARPVSSKVATMPSPVLLIPAALGSDTLEALSDTVDDEISLVGYWACQSDPLVEPSDALSRSFPDLISMKVLPNFFV